VETEVEFELAKIEFTLEFEIEFELEMALIAGELGWGSEPRLSNLILGLRFTLGEFVAEENESKGLCEGVVGEEIVGRVAVAYELGLRCPVASNGVVGLTGRGGRNPSFEKERHSASNVAISLL
jgi:hypothetical protein